MAEDHQQLLHQLKTTVEGLLINQVSNVWHIYGGLNRLHNVVHKIFRHGCKTLSQQGTPDCWTFIQGLSWLQPSLAASPTFISDAKVTQDKTTNWLFKSLQGHTLSQKLSWLLSDQQHLNSCFKDSALLCHPQYSEAVLICLRAVEQNQLSLLTDIDPTLFLPKWRTHRRCSSFPNAIMPRSEKLQSNLPPLDTEMSIISTPTLTRTPATIESSLIDTKREVQRLSKSLPCLLDVGTDKPLRAKQPKSAPVLRRPCTLPSSPAIRPTHSSPNIQEFKELLPNVLKIDYKQVQKDKSVPKSILKCSNKNMKKSSNEVIVLKEVVKSDPIVIQNKVRRRVDQNSSNTSSNGSFDILENKKKHHRNIHHISNSIYEETDSSITDSLSLTNIKQRVRLRSSGVRCGIKSNKRKSFLESGGSSVQPMSTGFFPRPIQGQSLASFLSSGEFAGARAELDRENAHFAISEAMIAAIEQVKYNMWAKTTDDTIEESDEEINHLKQRIRLRRCQKREEKQHLMLGITLLSDGKTDTTTTESASPLSSSPGGTSDTFSTDGVDDLEIDDSNASNLKKLTDSGLSLSLASLFSEAELARVPAPHTEPILSAEGVALALLTRFSDKQLPRASDISWLVSERDAGGQRLLPLPTSVPISPDEAENQDMRHATPLRGNLHWAPPRPQIIFTLHSPPKRKSLMVSQNYRCAGCGLPVLQKYASRYRYCEYLGRYFCTGCHNNQLALIPARIIHKWDFTKCAVSNFSYRLIDQMSSDPLFNINVLNNKLYGKVKALEKIRLYRQQLHYFKDFLNTCRFIREQESCLGEFLKSAPPHFLQEPHVYSIQDLTQVKEGEMLEKLKSLVQDAFAHVADCVLCQGRGFVCELCKKPEVIFPWQLDTVHRCNKCANCFHLACFKGQTSCGRCSRLNVRRKNSVLDAKDS